LSNCHALREYEQFFNGHRPHRTLEGAAPLRPRAEPITDPEQFTHLNVRRHDRLGGILHAYTTFGSAHRKTMRARTANLDVPRCDQRTSWSRSSAVKTNSREGRLEHDIQKPR
jgi:hypothetical protein